MRDKLKRLAFHMRLQDDDAVDRYEAAHLAVWPEVIEDLARCGVHQVSIYRLGLDVFVYSEVDDTGAWERHWGSTIAERFGAEMGPVLDAEYGEPARFLDEVYHETPQRSTYKRANGGVDPTRDPGSTESAHPDDLVVPDRWRIDGVHQP